MSDVNAAQGEAKAAVIEQLLHSKLNRNKNGTYNHDEIAKVEIIIKRVLKDLGYIAKDKFTGKEKGEWPKHKKKEATIEAVSTPK